MTVNERRQYWSDQVAAQKASGLTITEWCVEHGLNRRQFHNWIRNLKKQSATEASPASPNWMKVNMETKRQESATSSIVIRIGTASIEITHGFDPVLLAEAVRSLQTVC